MKLDTLIEMINRQQPDNDIVITGDTPLMDLGLSSLDMIVIACELEHVHGLSVKIDALKNIETVGQFYIAVTK